LRARVRFDAKGVITEWRGFDERWHHAAELFRQPKGKRRKSESERQDDNARQLVASRERRPSGAMSAQQGCRAKGKTSGAEGSLLGAGNGCGE
jgi:hypothetical protein